jgi:poly(A) polymerase
MPRLEVGSAPPQHDFQFIRLQATQSLFSVLQSEGIEARFVGGCVRDAIIGRHTEDYDVAVNSSIDKFRGILEKHAITYSDKWIRYGAFKVFIDKQEFDIVALRRDIDCRGRACSIEPVSSFEEDSKRRDFTINALYVSICGELFDYNGGLADLENRSVIFVGEPAKRIVEDNIRILRYYRFCSRMRDYSARYTEIMKEHAHLVADVPRDRVRKEILEIMDDDRIVDLMRTDGIWQALQRNL